MAGYSVFSYIVQVKDRHNGNILITKDGRVVHIGTLQTWFITSSLV